MLFIRVTSGRVNFLEVEVEGWSESGGGRTSIEAQSRRVERMGAHVDAGLQWDAKGDFILNFYFSLPSGRQGLLRVKKRW